MKNESKNDVALFTTLVETWRATIDVVASCVNTDSWLDKITGELHNFLQNKFALGQ